VPNRWIANSAIKAMMAPSPSLSARMINITNFGVTMIVIAQNTSEITPYTLAGVIGTGRAASREKTVGIAYSGLVPISPNTTPNAPSASAAVPAGWLPVGSEGARTPAGN
jgi:hypothetical protein